ncbi:MAG: hypothetical protein WC758_03870 [Candidatus Woesearchaeota archaeon]|jgi:hypothetical protein
MTDQTNIEYLTSGNFRIQKTMEARRLGGENYFQKLYDFALILESTPQDALIEQDIHPHRVYSLCAQRQLEQLKLNIETMNKEKTQGVQYPALEHIIDVAKKHIDLYKNKPN